MIPRTKGDQMKKIVAMCVLFLVASCGWSSRNNELTGQVKKVENKTPIVCYNHWETDISLGVVRNGIGSMSTQDMYLYVPDRFVSVLQAANKSGKIVKVTYDEKRVRWCVPDEMVTGGGDIAIGDRA
jgi:hypothetical protein